MAGIPAAEPDPVFELEFLPIPIIHRDFWFHTHEFLVQRIAHSLDVPASVLNPPSQDI